MVSAAIPFLLSFFPPPSGPSWDHVKNPVCIARQPVHDFQAMRAASLPATTLPTTAEHIFIISVLLIILRALEGLAFRDSFPLRYACGPLPSSGDEVSFGKTLKPASNSITLPDVLGSEIHKHPPTEVAAI